MISCFVYIYFKWLPGILYIVKISTNTRIQGRPCVLFLEHTVCMQMLLSQSQIEHLIIVKDFQTILWKCRKFLHLIFHVHSVNKLLLPNALINLSQTFLLFVALKLCSRFCCDETYLLHWFWNVFLQSF